MMGFVFYLSLLLLIAYTLLIGIYWIGWILIPLYKSGKATTQYSFSVLVPSRNEEDRIGACLHSLVQQKYDPELYEIIVINDHSTDTTETVVNDFIRNNPGHKIRLLNMADLHEVKMLKKAAITEAIGKAEYPNIILTDADCTRDYLWMETINSFMNDQPSEMIYAPVEFKAINVFEKVQSLEFAGLVAIGAAAIRFKNPNMCSAANLIFKKDVFFEVDGYKGNDGVASGDDEFLLHKVFKKYPDGVKFLKNQHAVVRTTANASLRELADQRRRWVSKSTKYENRYITAIMAGAYLFNAAVLFNLIFDFKFGLVMLLVKTLIEGLFLLNVMRFFGKSSYILLLPLAELFHILYVLVIGIWGNIGSYNWKNRTVK